MARNKSSRQNREVQRLTQAVEDLTRRLSSNQLVQGTPLPPHVTQGNAGNGQGNYTKNQLYQASQNLGHRQGKAQTPVDDTMLQNMGVIPNERYNEIVYNQNVGPFTQTMFSPGAPLTNVPGMESPAGPRAWDFPVGYNIAQLPRSTEINTFDQLRGLSLYEGIRLCERVWYDVLNRLELIVTLEDGVIPDGESDMDPKWQKIIQPAKEFLQYPDRERNLSDWLIASTTDVLEIGASAIFMNRSRVGKLLSLDLIDYSTLKPLLDDRGRLPEPPYPAYQQFIKGIPSGLYLANQTVNGELVPAKMQQLTKANIQIVREMSRTDSPYSRSRVEDIVLTINTALRLKHLNLTRYTDGSVPEGFLIPDKDSMSLDDYDKADEIERRLNGLIMGNDQQKVRMKLLPPGIQEFIATRPYDSNTEFDKWLLNISVAAFGITMAELGMTESVNRSSGDSQENVIYRRVVKPVASRFTAIFNRIVKEFDSRLTTRWGGIEEPEDEKAKAETLHIGVQAGAMSPSRMAHMMGWPVEAEIPAFIIAQGGPEGIVVLEDIEENRALNKQALQTKVQTAQAGLKIQTDQGQMLDSQVKQQQSPFGDQTPPSDEEEQSNAGQKEDDNSKDSGEGQESDEEPTSGDKGSKSKEIEDKVNQQINDAVAAKSGKKRVTVGEIERRIEEARLKKNWLSDDDIFTILTDYAAEYPQGSEEETVITEEILSRFTIPELERVAAYDANLHPRGPGGKWLSTGGKDIRSIGGMKDEIALDKHLNTRVNKYDAKYGKGAHEAKRIALQSRVDTKSGKLTSEDRVALLDHVKTLKSDLTTLSLEAADNYKNPAKVKEIKKEMMARATAEMLILTHVYREENSQPTRTIESTTINNEWRRYRDVALRAVRKGESIPVFTTQILPDEKHDWVAVRLDRAITVDDVRMVFQAAKDHTMSCDCTICGMGIATITRYEGQEIVRGPDGKIITNIGLGIHAQDPSHDYQRALNVTMETEAFKSLLTEKGLYQYTSNRGNEDIFANVLAKDLGRDGHPQQVNVTEMKVAVKASPVGDLWRGSSMDHATQFLSGVMSIRKWDAANGIYFAYGRKGKSNASYYATGALMHATIHPSARLIDIQEAERIRGEYGKYFDQQVKEARKSGDVTSLARYEALGYVFSDTGRAMMALGYDGIKSFINYRTGETDYHDNELVVLNRSAMIVEVPIGH